MYHPRTPSNKFVTKLAADEGPAYLRLVGETIPVILNDDHEPEIGHDETLRDLSFVERRRTPK